MKYYFIYKNKEYLGYTTDKKLLNSFIKIRKIDGIRFIKFDENELSESVKKKLISYPYKELIIYDGSKTPLFAYEYLDFEETIIEKTVKAHETLIKLLDQIKYLKFTDNEKEKVKDSIMTVFDIVNTMEMDEHEPQFSKYYKIDELLQDLLEEDE